MLSPKTVLLAVIASTAIAGSLHAQKSPIKPGKMSDALMKEDYIARYPGENAVVLADYGYLKFNMNQQHGWVYELEHDCRIKILNDEGYEWATHSIFLTDNGKINEKITELKGYVYNLENGKVVRTKMSKSSVFEEEVTSGRTKLTFTLPQVREGSIIEFSYRKVSDYIVTLPEWKFQRSIPVEHSELLVAVPEDFNYIMLTQGYGRFAKQEKSSRSRSMARYYTVESNEYGNANMRETVKSVESCVENVYHWVAVDQKALRNERFIGNPADFRLGLEFQLSTYKSGYQTKQFLGTWPQVNKQLIDDSDDFGPNMRPRSFYKEPLQQILTAHESPEERVAAIYSFVASNTQWDGRYRWMPENNLRQCYKEQSGSVADINGLLVSMLRAAELDAEPILISTRGHGMVNQAYPILDKFNYLIAGVWIENRVVLLDATDQSYPPGMLPERCLNGKGRVISEQRPSWVNLQPNKGYDVLSMYQMQIDEDGVVSGNITRKYNGYSGRDVAQVLSSKGESGYKQSLIEEHPGWEITSLEIDNASGRMYEIKESCEVAINGAAQVMGNMMYIDPLLGQALQDNPFKQEQRELPVDFTYPLHNQEIIRITLPEGYEVEELPEPIVASLPDKSISYKYLFQNLGSTIQIVHQLDQHRSLYLPDEYKALRELFAVIVAKEGEQIVLKKSGIN